MKVGDKVTITKGWLKSEEVTILGTTDLNMDHRLIVRRKKGRNKIMGFHLDELELSKG